MLPDDYGGWQLYLFYFYYTGFFHFGWLDGMYLRYGGSNYEDLNKTLYGTQIACLIGLESLLAICIIIGTYIYITRAKLKICSNSSINHWHAKCIKVFLYFCFAND